MTNEDDLSTDETDEALDPTGRYQEEYGTRESDSEIKEKILDIFERQGSMVPSEIRRQRNIPKPENGLETRISSEVLIKALRIVNGIRKWDEHIPKVELLKYMRELNQVGYPIASNYGRISSRRLYRYLERIGNEIRQQN